MGEQQFYDFVKEQIKEYIGEEDVTSRIETIYKNNNQSFQVLIIRRRQEAISPIIYLKEFYEKYESGEKIEDILCEIAMVFKEAREEVDGKDISVLAFEQWKDKLFFRLINMELNDTLWEMTPFIPWHDLALTVRLLVHESDGGISSILVTKKELEMWGVTWEEVVALAKENTNRLFPAKIMKILNDKPIYLLTNESELNGATAICYPKVLEDLGKSLQTSFYVLPSSIHEMLLLPDDGQQDIGKLRNLIKNANNTVVREEEILSYQLYYWEKSTGRMKIVKKDSEF